MKTFRCNFGNGLSVEMQTTDEPPVAGSHIQVIKWFGNRPNKSLFRPYVAWVNSVNKTLTDEWGLVMLHLFQIDTLRVEIWKYEPGKPPKCLGRTSWLAAKSITDGYPLVSDIEHQHIKHR